MAARSLPAVPSALALALLLGACGDCAACGEAETTGTAGEPERPSEPPEAPESLVWEASLAGGTAALGDLRDRLGGSLLREVVPPTPAALLERVAALPEGVAARVPEDGALHAIGIRGADDRVRVAAAARVRVDEARDHPLGREIPTPRGGPHGARWVGSRPAEGATAAALLGDALVVADDAATLERALPYLVWARLEAGDLPRGLAARVPDGVVGGRVRAGIEGWLADEVRNARLAVQAERARHAEPPVYGDPEQAIDVARERLERWIAFLPDVGEVRVRVTPEPGRLSIVADATVREGSPFAAALAALRPGVPLALGALPPDTAIAWSYRSDPGGGEPWIVPAITRVAGDRMDARARSSLDAAVAALESARGEGTLIAAGERPAGPWVAFASAPARGVLDANALRAVLSSGYVADVAGALVGCNGAATPGPFAAAGDARIAPLCTRPSRSAPPHPSLRVASSDAALVVALAQTASPRPSATDLPIEREAATAIAGAGSERPADPDVSRALAALGDHVLVSGLVVPSRLMAAATLVAVDPVRRAVAAMPRPPTAPAPSVVGLVRTERGAALRVELVPSAIDDLVTIFGP